MEIKEERRRARGWSARRRERGRVRGLPRAGGWRLRGGAEGRAERGARSDSFGVSGPRCFSAAWGGPRPEEGESRWGGSRLRGTRGSPRGGVTPTSLGGIAGARFSLLSLKFYLLPALRAALERSPRPPPPAASAPSQLF